MKFSAKFAIGFVLVVVLLSAAPSWAQTSDSALVLGAVTDPAGAVVPDATVSLTNIATNETKTVTTNSAGQYVFPNVTPGTYTIKISKTGFATTTFSNTKLDLTKSYTYDAKLEVSSGKETIEVSVGAVAELQTTDAVVGNVIGGDVLSRLPTLNRDATELLTLQPGSTPYDSSQVGFGNSGGTIAGARSDQNTVILDGIDITDNSLGGGGGNVPIIPVGVESVEEFRVATTNTNASFGRASGGQLVFNSKSGGNQYHGSVYWFHQNDNLNANSWTNNRTKVKKAEQKDNRGGFSAGGPILKNKTFVFGSYERRRFPQSFDVSRIVPTAALRSGILTFQDCAQGFDPVTGCKGGNQIPYNLATAANCGSSRNLACDPRGLGMSPTIQALWGLESAGTDPSVSGTDGFNTTGFRATVAAPHINDTSTFKLDHKFSEKVHFYGRYIYSRDLQTTQFQLDIRGNKAVPLSGSQNRGDAVIGTLAWQFTNNVTNALHVGWVRQRSFFPGFGPSDSATLLNLPGTTSPGSKPNIALAPGLAATGLIDAPIDVDTQRARTQSLFQRNKQYSDDLTWTKGKHILTFGLDLRWIPTKHVRNDKVIGSLTSLVATEDSTLAATTLRIPASDRPPTCGVGVTTNCLQPGDITRWNRLYAAALGLVDNVAVLATRDGNLKPLPFGQPLVGDTTNRAQSFYAQDTWRIKPSLTLTYGVSYGWQTTPHEKLGRQTLIVDATTSKVLSAQDYLNAKESAAENGQIYNPQLGYLPVGKTGRSDVFTPDYGDVAPRLALAWNPDYNSGLMSHVFGGRKTVVRGGYGIAYDRINTVGSVIIPMLGVGFAQTLTVVAPPCDTNGAAAAPGCSAASLNPALSAFRVGQDGAIPLPVNTAVTAPVIPAAPLGEILSFQNDPDFSIGRSHMLDFSIQRELPGNMIMEIGYVGKLARNLLNNVNYNSSPINFKDTASGRTFAQAFDAVAAQVRAGAPITNEPWFENQLAGLDAATCGGAFGGSNTQCLVAAAGASSFNDGLVSSLFLTMDFLRTLPPSQGGLGLPLSSSYNNLQVLDLFVRTHRDRSNYHSMIVTLRNRGWHGLQFDLNYTFSRSLDQIGTVQNSASYYASSFNRSLEYGPSFFDRTHIFNGIFNYDVPLGGSHRIGGHNPFLKRVLGGWYMDGIYRHSSGIPVTVAESGEVFGAGNIFGISNAAIPTVNPSSLGYGVHGGVAGGTNPTYGPTGTAGDPAAGGSGINVFASPQTAIDKFRKILISQDGRTGRGNPLRGFPFWNLDYRLGKETTITERFKFQFAADFFNIFNHPTFLDPFLDLTNPKNFGVVTDQLVPANRNAGSRWIQLSVRVSF